MEARNDLLQCVTRFEDAIRRVTLHASPADIEGLRLAAVSLYHLGLELPRVERDTHDVIGAVWDDEHEMRVLEQIAEVLEEPGPWPHDTPSDDTVGTLANRLASIASDLATLAHVCREGQPSDAVWYGPFLTRDYLGSNVLEVLTILQDTHWE